MPYLFLDHILKEHGAIRCSLKTQNPFNTPKKIIFLDLRQLCLPYTVKRTWFRIMTLFIINFKNHYLSNLIILYQSDWPLFSQLIYAVCKLLEQRRKLKPQRKERKKVAVQTICDRDIKILIRILRAYNIPTRKTTVNR